MRKNENEREVIGQYGRPIGRREPPFGNDNKKQNNEFSIAPCSTQWRHADTIKYIYFTPY